MNVEHQILEELKAIRSDLDVIKNNINKHDVDTVLSSDEEERLEESLKEYRAGKTISLEEFEKQMINHV